LSFSGISGSINQVYSQKSQTLKTLGTDDYLLIGFCPSMTALYGPGGTGSIPTTQKLGGIFFQQGMNDPQPWDTHLFTRVAEAKSMQAFYKDDMSSFA